MEDTMESQDKEDDGKDSKKKGLKKKTKENLMSRPEKG